MSYTSLNPIGKKGRAWNNARRSLKCQFSAMGITQCELNLAGCWKDNGLGFAHALKRRHLRPDQLSEVILVCNPCHDWLEKLGERKMEQLVKDVIALREVKLNYRDFDLDVMEIF